MSNLSFWISRFNTDTKAELGICHLFSRVRRLGQENSDTWEFAGRCPELSQLSLIVVSGYYIKRQNISVLVNCNHNPAA